VPERRISPPGTEPVLLAEAKSHLRLDDSLDDSDVNRLIAAAREYVEREGLARDPAAVGRGAGDLSGGLG
jgi:uncharacterized phiE125 gp8 family phage protein